MDKKTYYRTVSIIFAVLAVAHAARVWYGWPAVIGGAEIPVEMSWIAVGIAGYLAVRGWQFATAKSKR